MTSRRPILGIYAHPDDETSALGTYARLADLGHPITLVYGTRGEAGEISDPALATPETLGAVREGELTRALAQIGVTDARFLGYRDSGMAGTPDNARPDAFVNAGDERLTEIVTGLLHELHPMLVVTFGPDGLYGHPDHVTVSRAATAAVEAFGPTREEAPALYYQVMSRERIRRLAANGQGPFADMSEERLAGFGIPDAEITTIVDVTGQVDRKLAAIREHRTQFAPEGPFAGFYTASGRSFMAQERFRRVDLPWVEPEPDPLLALLGEV